MQKIIRIEWSDFFGRYLVTRESTDPIPVVDGRFDYRTAKTDRIADVIGGLLNNGFTSSDLVIGDLRPGDVYGG